MDKDASLVSFGNRYVVEKSVVNTEDIGKAQYDELFLHGLSNNDNIWTNQEKQTSIIQQATWKAISKTDKKLASWKVTALVSKLYVKLDLDILRTSGKKITSNLQLSQT